MRQGLPLTRGATRNGNHERLTEGQSCEWTERMLRDAVYKHLKDNPASGREESRP